MNTNSTLTLKARPVCKDNRDRHGGWYGRRDTEEDIRAVFYDKGSW